VPHPERNIRTFRCERTTCRGYRVPGRGRWGHGSHARQPRRREAARVACPAWRPDPARCLGPGHWRPCRVAGLCRVAGPPAAGLPLRQAAAGLGPDMRQRGVRCPAARTGGRHRNLQTLTRCHLRTRAKKPPAESAGYPDPQQTNGLNGSARAARLTATSTGAPARMSMGRLRRKGSPGMPGFRVPCIRLAPGCSGCVSGRRHQAPVPGCAKRQGRGHERYRRRARCAGQRHNRK
jgi:hypothetical protein